jgi:Big-like domain-containing protein
MRVFRTLPRLLPLLLGGAAWIPGIAQERGPELRALTFSPSTIDASSSAAKVIINFQTIDRGLGATSFEIGFASPSGTHSEKASTSFAATGSYAGSVPVTFPALCEPGNWTISHVLLSNAEGYSRLLTEQDLRAQGVSTSLRVISRADTSSPTVTSFRLAPASVDVTSGPAEVLIELEAKDDLSGVKGVEVSFDSPSGTETRHVSAMVSRPSTSAKIPLVLKFTPSAEAGTWKAAGLVLTDVAGNTLVMNGDDFGGRGFPTAIEVKKTVDITPPVLTELKLSPSRINLAAGSSAVKVEFAATDDLSGAVGMEISFLGPSGATSRKAEAILKPAARITGSATVEFSRWSETGEWRVAAVLLVDAAGNTRVLNTAELTAKGFPNHVEVVSEAPPEAGAASGHSTQPDTTPPALTALEVTPSTVNSGLSRVPVTFHFSVADDDSGVTAVQVGMVSPSGAITLNGSASFVAARSHTGTVTIQLPQSPEPGDWEIATVVVSDAAGNTRVLSSQDLRNRGVPSRLAVTPAAATAVEKNVAVATLLLAAANDQPAGFDVRVELYLDDVVTAAGQAYCISGLADNSGTLKSVSVSLDMNPAASARASGPLSIRVLARMGTSQAGKTCEGAAKSNGLRIYSGKVDWPSRLVLGPSLESRVTLLLQQVDGRHVLAPALLSDATATTSESGSLGADSGNPWKEVGVWRVAQ